MAAVLVIERDPTLRELLVTQLRHLGHQPVSDYDASGSVAGSVDVAVVETAGIEELLVAHRLRAWRPELPLVIVSIHAPTAETRTLEPVAHVLKPAGLAELSQALSLALGYGAETAESRAAPSSATRSGLTR